MSSKSVAQKLFIKAGERILILDAPKAFENALGSLPEKVEVHTAAQGQFDLIQCFAKTRPEMENLLPSLKEHLNEDGRLWIGYPKGTSKKYDSEINRDSIWHFARTIGMTAVSLIAIDQDWSTLRLKPLE